MVASVPELTKRSFSIEGTAATTSSARSASAAVEAPKLVPRSAARWIASTTAGGMTQDHRPPGTEIIQVAIAIGVPQIRSLGSLQERRISTHRAKGAHRRIYASWQIALRAPLQFSGKTQFSGHGIQYMAMLNWQFSGIPSIQSKPPTRTRKTLPEETSKSKKPPVTYASAGVDLSQGDRTKQRIKYLAQKTFNKQVLGEIGGFGGLFRLDTAKYCQPHPGLQRRRRWYQAQGRLCPGHASHRRRRPGQPLCE